MTLTPDADTIWQMYQDGKCGKTLTSKGYVHVRPTRWYTGKLYRNFVALHVLICCAANDITEVPPDHDVHHIDHNKLNNAPSNLQLLTHSDHARLHALDRHAKRKEKR